MLPFKSEVEFESPGFIEDSTCEGMNGKICKVEERCNIPTEVSKISPSKRP